MSIPDKIVELIEEELNERMNTLFNEYAETISKKHGISLNILLRDLPEICSVTLCKGQKSDGRRCMFKGIHNGYCRHHKEQGEKIRQRVLTSEPVHTHGNDIMFLKSCPACNISNRLIDLKSILNNE
jgi:hypothetical protein